MPRTAREILSDEALAAALRRHRARALPMLDRLWAYYRNPLEVFGRAASGPPQAGGWYRQAQEAGLPPRLARDTLGRPRREIVIENDIAWRVHTMVDFLFGRGVRIRSTARDAEARRRIDEALAAILEASGGGTLLHDLALIGHVFGHADLLVRTLDTPEGNEPPVRFEVVEPRRGIAILDPTDYRRIRAYIVHAPAAEALDERAGSAGGGVLADLVRTLAPRARPAARPDTTTEVFAGGERRVYRGERLIHREDLAEDAPPVAHVQNTPQPFAHEGVSEVEPLIPLQDELNTRLSDRANRVTLQSFKMYLARGIDGFEGFSIAPGQVWSTDNPDARIEAFGGDADSPSETAHVLEVREAMDKVSGVPPLAAGVVRAKIGNLSSANALRVTLMGLLTKTERKRAAYGRGLAHACRLALAALDREGVMRTDPADRGVRFEWPDPIPEDPHQQALAAQAKAALGVPRDELLHELGHAPAP